MRNFERFQHYTDRRPPWIKLYRDLWDDPRFFSLSDAHRFMLISLFVLASQHDNKVSADMKWLKAKLLTKSVIPLQMFIDTGWIEAVEQDASSKQDASAVVAQGYPSRAGGETEVQKNRNTETETDTPIVPLLELGEFKRVQLTAEQYEKLKSKLNGHHEAYIEAFDHWVNEAPKARPKGGGPMRSERHAYESITAWFNRDVREGKIKTVVSGKTSSQMAEELRRRHGIQ